LVDWRRFMPLNRSFLLRLLKLTTETLIRVHPEEENSVSGNMLLHLLKLGIIMRIKSELPNKLEKRLALKLES
jgi:mannose-6-phosphate isomerase class I